MVILLDQHTVCMYKSVRYLCYIPGSNRVFRSWKDTTEQEAIVDYSTQIVDDIKKMTVLIPLIG
jgi:hypothetical protein